MHVSSFSSTTPLTLLEGGVVAPSLVMFRALISDYTRDSIRWQSYGKAALNLLKNHCLVDYEKPICDQWNNDF